MLMPFLGGRLETPGLTGSKVVELLGSSVQHYALRRGARSLS